jgi:hypothetical protein
MVASFVGEKTNYKRLHMNSNLDLWLTSAIKAVGYSTSDIKEAYWIDSMGKINDCKETYLREEHGVTFLCFAETLWAYLRNKHFVRDPQLVCLGPANISNYATDIQQLRGKLLSKGVDPNSVSLVLQNEFDGPRYSFVGLHTPPDGLDLNAPYYAMAYGPRSFRWKNKVLEVVR